VTWQKTLQKHLTVQKQCHTSAVKIGTLVSEHKQFEKEICDGSPVATEHEELNLQEMFKTGHS